MAAPSARLAYLDWLRGLAVLIMVLAHVVDSWTEAGDRHATPYYVAVFIGGIGAPMFLFLAGVAIVLSAYARSRAAGDAAVGARLAIRRGAEVFVLGLIFRLQSQLLGWGPLSNLLKVDILNVMGLSMMAAAWIWQTTASRARRIALFAAAAGIVAMITPLVRSVAWLAMLPDPIEAYLRPDGHYASFTLLPWAGFVLAGALVGELIDMSRGGPLEKRVQRGLFAAGAAGAALAWWASFRPAIYPDVGFWTSSPTFFFIRLGIITMFVPAGWAHCRFWLTPPDSSPVEARRGLRATWFGEASTSLTRALEAMGRSSLFVYWIHVEMVYGVIAEPLKRTLPLWGSLVATLLMCLWLYVLTLAKNRWLRGLTFPGPIRILAAVLR